MASLSNNVTGFAQVTLVPTATIGGSKIDMLTHQNYYSWAPRAKAILKEKQWRSGTSSIPRIMGVVHKWTSIPRPSIPRRRYYVSRPFHGSLEWMEWMEIRG
jgi:hypothetical protein